MFPFQATALLSSVNLGLLNFLVWQGFEELKELKTQNRSEKMDKI
jgi:hypothetical protein